LIGASGRGKKRGVRAKGVTLVPIALNIYLGLTAPGKVIWLKGRKNKIFKKNRPIFLLKLCAGGYYFHSKEASCPRF
jgi:hypothetical protein